MASKCSIVRGDNGEVLSVMIPNPTIVESTTIDAESVMGEKFKESPGNIDEAEQWAKDNNLWIEDYEEGVQYLSQGGENIVYTDNVDESIVRKVNFEVDDVQEFVKSISDFNTMSPNTPYTIKGFTRLKRNHAGSASTHHGIATKGDFAVVLEQPKIDSARAISREEVSNYMKTLGFSRLRNSNDFVNEDGSITIGDIREDNLILSTDGNYHIIDAAVEIEDIQLEMENIKNRSISNGSFMKAPNGNPTNLTERQWLQVRTKNFKNWFGDWEKSPETASKVVDANGEPLVVYHSTTADRFYAFDPNKSHEKVMHFGTKEAADFRMRYIKTAEHIKTYATFLNIRNIVRVEDIFGEIEVTREVLKDASEAYARGETPRTDNKVELAKIYIDEGYTGTMLEWYRDVDYGVGTLDEMRDILRKQIELLEDKKPAQTSEEIDGAIYTNTEEDVGNDSYMVFNPNQIKSAEINNGEFNSESNDIRRQVGDGTLTNSQIANLVLRELRSSDNEYTLKEDKSPYNDWFQETVLIKKDMGTDNHYDNPRIEIGLHDGRWSVLEYVVPEAMRGNKEGSKILDEALDYLYSRGVNELYGQSSNPLSAEMAFRRGGYSPTYNTIEEVTEAIKNNSSSLVIIPTKKKFSEKNTLLSNVEDAGLRSQILHEVIQQLQKTGLASGVNILSPQQIEQELVKRGVDAKLAKQVSETGGYYSNANTAFSNLKDKNVKNVQGWMKALTDVQKNGGIKNVNQELKWIGLEDYLNEYVKENNPKNGNIPASVVEDYIKSNQIEIVDVSKGKPEIDINDLEAEFYGSGFTIRYSGEGGLIEPYITLDQIGLTEEETYEEDFDYYSAEVAAKEAAREEMLDREDGEVKYSDYQLKGGENYREVLLTMPNSNLNSSIEEYKSSHWDEANILAHVRLNEKTLPDGRRVLIVNEVQSDWAQDGRKEGFLGSSYLLDDTFDSKKQAEDSIQLILNDVESYEAVRVDGKYRIKATSVDSKNSVPNMPYKNTDQWVGLVTRRVMQMASQEGYDGIAFATGQQSADMYSLARQADELRYSKNSDGTYNINIFKDSGNIGSQSNVTEVELENYVGKEIAQRISNNEGEQIENEVSLTGVDLEVGGEGMKTFYDKIVPKVVQKEARRFDKNAKLETIDFSDNTFYNEELYLDLQWQIEDFFTGDSNGFEEANKILENWKSLPNSINYNKVRDLFNSMADSMDGQREDLRFEQQLNQSVNIDKLSLGVQPYLPLTQPIKDSVSQSIPQFQKEGIGLLPNGFVDLKTKEVFLNQETVNLDTPIHEFAHLYNQALKQSNPTLYNKGIELVNQELDKDFTLSFKTTVEKEEVDVDDEGREIYEYREYEKFSSTFGNDGRIYGRIRGEKATVTSIYSPLEDGEILKYRKGNKLYERLLLKLKNKGVKTLEVPMPSADSQAVLNRLVEKGVLVNPRGMRGVSTNMYPTVFDIDYSKITESLSEIQDIIDYVKNTQPNLEGESLAEEVLTELIGRRGVELLNKTENKKSPIIEWLKEAFESIKQLLGLSKMTTEQAMNLTLQQFAEAMAVDLLRGEELNLDTNKAFNEGVEAVAKLANEYKKEFEIDSVQHNKVGKLFPTVSKMIAEAYEQSETGITTEEVEEAYKALEKETLQQYKFAVDKGLKVSRWTGEGEPYPNSKSMLKDVKENNHLYFLPNSEAFGKEGDEVEGRVGLKITDVYLEDGYRMTLSEVFRVVHDYFGHGILGNQFGAVGEENATLQHLGMYSPKALPAVIFQTRGQNSWVNFSGVNDEALRKIREGSKTNNKNLLKEGQEEFRFATPKDNILPKIFNFKTYETARRINEQEEIRKSEAYLDPRGKHEDTYISELLTRHTSRNSGKLNGFSRRSLGVSKRLGDYDVDVIAEYEGNKEVERLIKNVFPQFKGTQKIYEISNGDVYRELMIEALETNKFKSSVTVHSAEDFSNMRLFVTEDGSTGITLTKDGFLGGAFGNPKADRPNNLAQMMLLGIKEGAITAEAFDTVLPNYYSMFGFKAVSRTAFNEEYRPLKENGALEDWDYDTYSKFNNGRPDVVFFIYDGGNRETIQERIGQFDSYSRYQKDFTESYDKDSYDGAYRFMEVEAINKNNYQNQETTSQQGTQVLGQMLNFAMQYASESELLRDTNGNVIGVKPEVLEEIRKEREQIETEARERGEDNVEIITDYKNIAQEEGIKLSRWGNWNYFKNDPSNTDEESTIRDSVEDIDVSKIVSTETISELRLEQKGEYIKPKYDEYSTGFPVAIRVKGSILLLDGHHRLELAKRAGESTIKVAIKDLQLGSDSMSSVGMQTYEEVIVENPIDTVNNTPITNPLVKMPNRYRVAYDLGEINEEALFNQSYLTNEVRDYIIERNPELEGKDFTAQQIAQGVNVDGAISENLDTNEGYQKALEVQRKVNEGLLPWSALTPAIQSELLLETNPIVEVSEETEISSPLFESIKRLPIIDSEQALLIYQESFSTSLENWEDLDTKC